MDSKSEHAEMYSKNERNLMDLDDDTHREDQFSSSYETPTVTATHKEPTGMRPKFFEESILKQRREIERLQELLAAKDQQLNEQGHLITKMKTPFEPAPATDPTLTPRVPRPQDIAYEETMRRQKAQEEAMKILQTPQEKEQLAAGDLIKVLSQLATIVTDNRTASDVSEAPKFSGRTEDWDTWYQQFRTYLKAKGWLDTFLHPTGPGTPGFNQGINEKIYNKLTILCGNGNALTYVQSAAEFDGHGAGQKLLARYDGFSKQRNTALRKLISTMKHTSGTSITDHTDLFEKLCGQIISSGQPPTEEEKLDWFMDSITEPIYEYTKQHCKHLRLLGTLTYPVMANLYKLTCFEKYPHFHVKAQNGITGTGLKTLINNSLSHGRGRTKGKGQGRSREKGNGKGDRQGKGNSKGRGRNQSNTNQGRRRGNGQKNQGNADKRQDGEKSKEKGKNKGKQPVCQYCEKQGHISRDCFKRMADENTTTTTTNSSQQLTIEDDLDILFQNTLYVRSDDEESDDETMEEEVVYRPTYTMSQETTNSDTVFTAQTAENHDQNEEKITIMGDQSTLTFEGKTRPNTRLTCPPPLVTMIEKWVRKRAPHTAKSRHAPNQVNNLRLSRRPKVPKRATQKEQNKRETLEK